MQFKITVLILVFACCQLQAQDYVDVIKLSSNNATFGKVGDDYNTSVFNQQLQLYLPKRISEKFVVIGGATIENTNMNVVEGGNRENLLMTRLNLGVKYEFSERWSGKFFVLPKLASNFRNITWQDAQMGGLVQMVYKLSETWSLNFGLYVSSENHGSTITPLLGVWHRSKNGKFYIDATLPIRADVNYSFTKAFSIGADLLTSIKSYDIFVNDQDLYVHEQSIRAGAYIAYGLMDNAFIIRLRAGFDTTDYGLYNSGDQVGGQILIFDLQPDQRTRLNPEFASAFYFGGDLIYRFDLRKEKK